MLMPLNTQHHQTTLITPDDLLQQLPGKPEHFAFIKNARKLVSQIIQGNDKRLMVVVGPCSIHDPKSALEYAEQLADVSKKYSDDLCIIMRSYFQKPRTTLGWKGLMNDPYLDNSFDINYGLWLARKLTIEFTELQLPIATEFVNPITHHYLSDYITWSSVGARTVESQLHRELASGLAMPVGFKNNTDGNIKVAIDAVKVAAENHHYVGLLPNGSIGVTTTSGNRYCHIVMRGSRHFENYSNEDIKNAVSELKSANLNPAIMVDCSHGNSKNDPGRQSEVIETISQQILNGSYDIIGVMLESNLIAGKQLLKSAHSLVYGQSITDGCIGWNETVNLLDRLALSIHKRNN